MEMMLQTQNLCKYFRKQKAVNNVSLADKYMVLYPSSRQIHISTHNLQVR